MTTERHVYVTDQKKAMQIVGGVQQSLDPLGVRIELDVRNNVNVRDYGAEISISAVGIPVTTNDKETALDESAFESVKDAQRIVAQSVSFLEELGLAPEIRVAGGISVKDIGLSINYNAGKCGACQGGCSGCTGCQGTCDSKCGGCQGAPNTISIYETVSQPQDFEAFRKQIVTDILAELKKGG